MSKWFIKNKKILFMIVLFNITIFSYGDSKKDNLLNKYATSIQNQQKIANDIPINTYQSMLNKETITHSQDSEECLAGSIIYPNGLSFLHIAVMTENIPMINTAFMYQKALINAKDDDGCTPLHYAILIGNLVVIELLVDAEADLNIANNKGDTPIFLAVQKDSPINNMQYLIQKGADISLQNKDENTLLDVAYQYRRMEIIKYLRGLLK